MKELGNEPNGSAVPTKTVILGLDPNLAGLLCYAPVPLVGLVCSIVWLCTEPKSNKFVRFHAVQSLCLMVIGFVPCVLLSVLGMIGLGLLVSLVSTLISVVLLAACIICMIQAWNNQMFRLPIIGDFAFELA